jgi:hypothetical protein
LNETDTTWKFYVKVNINGKLNYLEINMPFNSVEDLNQKNQILLYI